MRHLLAIAIAAAAPLWAVATAHATPPPPPRSATDCAARVYVIDDIVCATPALLALDQGVAAAFAAAPDGLNPEWPRMVEGQNAWYYRSRQCFKVADQPACLTAAYQDRLVELAILAHPPAPGSGQAGRCVGPPWVEGRDVFLNSTTAGPLVVSDPKGQVLAIALPSNSMGWNAFVGLKRDMAPWRLRHFMGAELVCKPA